jgi:hypothetical protein
MTRKVAQLLQLFLEVFAVYTILKGQLFISLLCLVVIFLIAMYKRNYITTRTEDAAEPGATSGSIMTSSGRGDGKGVDQVEYV